MEKQRSWQKPVSCGKHCLTNRQKTATYLLLSDILNQIPIGIKTLSIKGSLLLSVRILYTLLWHSANFRDWRAACPSKLDFPVSVWQYNFHFLFCDSLINLSFSQLSVFRLRGGWALMIKVILSFYTISVISRRQCTSQSRSVSLPFYLREKQGF